MPGKRYNDAKKEIRSVLLTYKEPVPLEEFLKTYRNLLGERLPSRALGYGSDIEFLKSMSDVVHVSTSEIGRIVLYGIADESSQHIQKLVSKQRKVNKPKRKLPVTEPFNMPVSARGLHPYVPGRLRAEILELAAMFPDGVALPAFVLAYRKKFNKYLSLEQGLETLEHMIESIKELELKTVRREKKICCKNMIKKAEDSFLPQAKDTDNEENIRKANVTKVHKSGISAQIQKNFQLVLQKCSEGILAIYFPPLYENVTGQSFDLHELGYNSILELADALPDIFKRILDPCDDKNWILLPANSTLRFDYRSEKIRETAEDSPLSNHKGLSPLKLREGIPADVAPPHLHYVQSKMPENISLNEYLPIFVTAIVNPSLFWFQLQTDDVFEKFEAFENNLGSFYSSYPAARYIMNDADVIIGAICVVQCPDDKQWYRAVIKSIPSVNLINVLFIDYGSRENIPRANLRYVRSKYLSYPAAAFRAELAGLKPPKNSTTWDIRGQQRFIQLCESTSLMAYLKPVNDDSFSTYLCDTGGETDIHINDTLIKEGHAELCFGNLFNKNILCEETSLVISNGVDHGIEDNLRPKSPSTNYSSYDSKKYVDHGIKPGNKDNFIPETKMLPVNRKISLSMDKQPCDTESNISHVLKPHSCKRYVKPLKLCEDTEIFIINMKDKLYVSTGDLSNLFWKDKDMTYLAERLKYKEVNVPSVEIAKEDNSDLFQQCEWYKIPDFKNSQRKTTLLILYPLEWAFNILNIFGHPSICSRLAIQNEIKNFNPEDSIWKEFCYDESCDLLNIEKEIEEKLGKLCLYDLKAKYEALKIKRLKLLKRDNTCSSDEIKRLEHLQCIIERRMKYIEAICSQYSSYS